MEQLSARIARQVKSLRVRIAAYCRDFSSRREMARVTLAEFSWDCEDGVSPVELFFCPAEILTVEPP